MHPTGGSLRVFRQFAWLEVDSVKMAFSRPAHQRVTQAVGTHLAKQESVEEIQLKRCKISGGKRSKNGSPTNYD